MTLAVYPNALSFSSIKTEFGISGQVSLSGLYRNDSGPVYTGVYGYPSGGSATEPPTSGTINFGKFHGAAKYTPSSQTVTLYAGSSTWTVPHTLIGNLTIRAFGGGGGGCRWPSGAAGGGGGGGAYYVGSIARGTTISYTVAAAAAAVYGDSTRYARDPGNTQFGTSSDAWYMYIPGLGVGGYNMSGEGRAPGVGSTAQGAAGVVKGVGGNGSPERTYSPGFNATTIGGGGGGCAWSNGGAGAYGGGAGGNAATNGTWPAGGAGGIDGGYNYVGADGAIIIQGTW